MQKELAANTNFYRLVHYGQKKHKTAESPSWICIWTELQYENSFSYDL